MASLTDIVNPITDALGITDSQSGKRAHNAMVQGQQQANQQLDSDLSGAFEALQRASAGRDFGQNLGTYDSQMDTAMGDTARAGAIAGDQLHAGGASNVRNYLNPMMDEMLARTNQAMQGNAGSALQSSATNKEIGSAVSQKAGDLWNTAFNQAMGDAQNNLNTAQTIGQTGSQTASLAGQQLAANNQPFEDLLSLQNDRAMQRYAANTGTTQADMTLAGQKNTIL
jgi:hypothetical protein